MDGTIDMDKSQNRSKPIIWSHRNTPKLLCHAPGMLVRAILQGSDIQNYTRVKTVCNAALISKNSENNTPEQMGTQGNPPSFNFVYLLLDMQASYIWFYFQLVKKLALRICS